MKKNKCRRVFFVIRPKKKENLGGSMWVVTFIKLARKVGT
jgi:hypothetical protein